VLEEPSSGPNLIEVHGLTRVHGTGPAAVRALDGLDLVVRRGGFVAVVGVSGSGKSSLLHVLGCLDTPTAGSIRVNGHELGSLSALERARYRRTVVGFVFQAFHLIPSMTALENVALALTFQGVYGEERRQRATAALSQVGLERRTEHRPGELSGGEQQRVALARALVHRPPLLLADEPTGNLDRQTAREAMDLVRAIHREQGTTVVLVTHDEEMAGRVAERIVRLRDGRVLREERP
jgi:predicted ABC-type transport system involved in lysophospholipase L1 biosynthesis ATPase subunit